MSSLQKTRNVAEEEIVKLKALRQLLVEKNLNGTYSDEIFREQNKTIEEKIIAAQIAKNDALIDKYDISKIENFIKRKISNLEETYSDPKNELQQIRSFLRSIFLSGFKWEYPGCSNDVISPLYQPILEVEEKGFPLGDPNGNRTHDFRDESPTS